MSIQRHSQHTFATAAGELVFQGFNNSKKDVLSIHGVLDSIAGTGNIQIKGGNSDDVADALVLKNAIDGTDIEFDVTAGNFIAEVYTPQAYRNIWVQWPATVTGGTMDLYENDDD